LNSSRQLLASISTSKRLAAAWMRFHARSRSASLTPLDLIEARYRVPHVPCIGQRLLALLGEGEL